LQVPLTAKDVAEITRLLEESSFDELYLELDGMKLTVRRGSPAPEAGAPAPRSDLAAPPAQAPASRETQSTASPAAQTTASPGAQTTASHRARAATSPVAQPDPSVMDVPSPLLGTFYRAPKPGAPPFIEVGSLVEKETIVGIIEVMKLMNTVRAGVQGRVIDILARDGTLVEYGEPLLKVRRTS
jgi:acetyl-CoA carboxylase biotin carboxyl carrier protein